MVDESTSPLSPGRFTLRKFTQVVSPSHSITDSAAGSTIIPLVHRPYMTSLLESHIEPSIPVIPAEKKILLSETTSPGIKCYI